MNIDYQFKDYFKKKKEQRGDDYYYTLNGVRELGHPHEEDHKIRIEKQ